MDPKEKRRGLGRGLSALMADVDPAPQATATAPSDRSVAIELVHPNPDQPRQTFDPESLEELAASISERGILQPLIVRAHPTKEGEYEIVAGERRWRAAQKASLHTVPIVERNFSDTEVLEVAIVENVQRSDLNPIEEAMGYHMLIDRFGHTQDKVAKALGKSRSHIANLIRLLSLPPEILERVRSGDLSMGHARALLTAEHPRELMKQILQEGLSVRETEKRAKSPKVMGKTKGKSGSTRTVKDADTRALEGELSAHLRMPVSIDHIDGTEGGRITLTYRDFEQLDELCQLLSGDR